MALSLDVYGAHPLDPMRSVAKSGIPADEEPRAGTEDEGVAVDVVDRWKGIAAGGGMAVGARGVRAWVVDENEVPKCGRVSMETPLRSSVEAASEDRCEQDEEELDVARLGTGRTWEWYLIFH